MMSKNIKSLNKRFKNFIKWMNEDLDISTNSKFLISLKIGLSLILPSQYLGNHKFHWNSEEYRSINRENLSIFLDQNKYHIKEVAKKAKYDSNYVISLEFINKMEKSIRIKLSNLNVPEKIINYFLEKLISAYILKYNPPYSNRSKSKKFHPNLNEDYFANIDSTEKAYWLGLLWADGWISKKERSRNGNLNFIIGLKQSEQNKEIVKNYCEVIGFNQQYLKRYRNNKSNSWYYQAKFMNNRFANYLIQLGFIVGEEKSLNIHLPHFSSKINLGIRELYLGFLLGYYDGDGTKGRTYITSGSFKFINQIRIKFHLNNKIISQEYQKKDGSRGKTYKLALGRYLMCEMLINYQHSFEPKRIAIFPHLKGCNDKLIIKKRIE